MGRICDSLSLEVIAVTSVNHIANVDKGLGTPHRLDKVIRTSHLGHEFNKELGTTVGIDTLHQTIDGPDQAIRVRQAIVMNYRRICSSHWIRRNRIRIGRASSRSED